MEIKGECFLHRETEGLSGAETRTLPSHGHGDWEEGMAVQCLEARKVRGWETRPPGLESWLVIISLRPDASLR